MRYDLNSREVFFYGNIEEDKPINAADFVTVLSKLGPGDITIRINSQGGEVCEAAAMLAAMDRHDGSITTINDGVVASAASSVYACGDTRLTCQDGRFMIHAAHSLARGDKAEMKRRATDLEVAESVLKARLLAIGWDQVFVDELFEGEDTWFTADEAVENGLATGFDENKIGPNAAIETGGLKGSKPALAAIKAQSRKLFARGTVIRNKAIDRREKLFAKYHYSLSRGMVQLGIPNIAAASTAPKKTAAESELDAAVAEMENSSIKLEAFRLRKAARNNEKMLTSLKNKEFLADLDRRKKQLGLPTSKQEFNARIAAQKAKFADVLQSKSKPNSGWYFSGD